MRTTSIKRWWLPGALLALAGVLFVAASADADRPAVWLSVGAASLVAAGAYLLWRRPRLSGDGPRA